MFAERTVVVARPAEAVFEVLAEVPQNTFWREGVRELTRMTNSAGVGAVYRQVKAGPGGRDLDCDYLITEYDPPHRLGFAVVAGPVRPTGSFELVERDGHTQVTFCVEVYGQGLRRLTAPFWSRALRREVAQLDRLKAVLEADRSSV